MYGSMIFWMYILEYLNDSFQQSNILTRYYITVINVPRHEISLHKISLKYRLHLRYDAVTVALDIPVCITHVYAYAVYVGRS